MLFIASCSGTKKYFKAAEKLELQGLISDAAEYYYQSLHRKPSNTDARIKLKEVGQRYVSSLSSEFFRNYNTQQVEASLETFEKLKDFNARVSALGVELNYPKTYENDYLNAVERYNSKNYNLAKEFVVQKKFSEAINYINKVKKYNAQYRDLPRLEIVAICEPLYQAAVRHIENKNYAGAYTSLLSIKAKTDNYKDAQQLLELADAQQHKSLLLLQPTSSNSQEKAIESTLFNNFNQAASQSRNIKIINNTPFKRASSSEVDLTQAIRKATGADYFYIYNVKDVKEIPQSTDRTKATAWQETTTRSGTTTVTNYNSVTYYTIKSQRGFSYTFKYQLVDANNNQIIEKREQPITIQDAIEYNETSYPVNSLYPYNPPKTPLVGRINLSSWRGQFNARKTLKSNDELKDEANRQVTNLFINSTRNIK